MNTKTRNSIKLLCTDFCDALPLSTQKFIIKYPLLRLRTPTHTHAHTGNAIKSAGQKINSSKNFRNKLFRRSKKSRES